MDAAMEANLARMADHACRQACESLAAGVCVDDGEVSGIARVETSRDAARWLLRNPAPGTPAAEAARMRGIAELPIDQLRPVLDTQASVRSIPGKVEVHPVDDLDSAEFMRLSRIGRAALMRDGRTEAEATTEWLWQYAEAQTGIKRYSQEWAGVDSAQSRKLQKAKNAAYQRIYRNS